MLLLALAVATGLVPGWHGDEGPPPAAFGPARFAPLPTRAVALCRRMPARAVCPARLPRPFITARGRGRPPFRAEVLRVGHGPVGIEFAYSAAVEPPARGWRRHVWWNRPCCSVHFTVHWRLEGFGRIPEGTRDTTLAGRRGRLLSPTGYGLASGGDRGRYWGNHAWFLWRDERRTYAASLHVFGRGGETRRLLGRMIRELRPVRELR